MVVVSWYGLLLICRNIMLIWYWDPLLHGSAVLKFYQQHFCSRVLSWAINNKIAKSVQYKNPFLLFFLKCLVACQNILVIHFVWLKKQLFSIFFFVLYSLWAARKIIMLSPLHLVHSLYELFFRIHAKAGSGNDIFWSRLSGVIRGDWQVMDT